MPIATMTSNGQITLPEEVMEHLRLEEGDQVEFVIDEKGDVCMRPLVKPTPGGF